MRDDLISFEYALYRNNEHSPEPNVLEWLPNTAIVFVQAKNTSI